MFFVSDIPFWNNPLSFLRFRQHLLLCRKRFFKAARLPADGKEAGGMDTPFGAKAFCVIRKGGAVITQTARYATTAIIYNRQSFTIPSPETGTFGYLKPE